MKIITVKAAILAIAVITGVGLLPSCMFTNNGKEINEVRTVEMNSITSIKIKAISAEVQIIPTTETVARVSLTGKSGADKILFSVAPIENQLVVECDEKLSTFSDLTVKIEIPSNINYAIIDTRVVSGEIGISGLQASEVLLKSTSGGINITDMTITSVDGTIDAKLISGKITATNIKGSVHAETGSGGIEISYADKAYTTHAKTISGSIEVGIPAGSGFSYAMQTTSGSKNCEFYPNSSSGTVGSGGPHIDLKTTAGSIQIKKL